MAITFDRIPYIETRTEAHEGRLAGHDEAALVEFQHQLDHATTEELAELAAQGITTAEQFWASRKAESTAIKTAVFGTDADALEAATTLPSGEGTVGTPVTLADANLKRIMFSLTSEAEAGAAYYLTKTEEGFTVNTTGTDTPTFDWIAFKE